ncbi:MAG: hypothetical protein ACD_14C00070G0001 [uncultured bacterium]|nr:MAG: hypothetical protein ACD_14C00070G0001 [uncultured bacterium]
MYPSETVKLNRELVLLISIECSFPFPLMMVDDLSSPVREVDSLSSNFSAYIPFEMKILRWSDGLVAAEVIAAEMVLNGFS